MPAAVMSAVDEFGRGLLKEIGAPAGRIKTYTEVPLEDDDGKKWRPDGAIVLTYGQRTWRTLVEVKTNNAPLKLLGFYLGGITRAPCLIVM